MLHLPRLSTFPLDKPFSRVEATSSLSEVALRLVVNFYSDNPRVVGTATVLAGHLLITAKHVIVDALGSFPADGQAQLESDNHLAAVQIVSGPHYLVWDVVSGIASAASDLALLRLSPNPGRSEHASGPHKWKSVSINPFPPAVGERVVGFGYHSSKLRVSPNAQGGLHIDLNDEPTASVGLVREVFELRRDNAVCPFPCYQVGARFEGGMSGGPVFEETGCLCGIVCSSIAGSHLDGEPVSYVSSLWPIFPLGVDADRQGKRSDVMHPLIEVARGGVIRVPDLPRLEHWLADLVGPL